MRKTKVELTLLVSFLLVVMLAACDQQKDSEPSAPTPHISGVNEYWVAAVGDDFNSEDTPGRPGKMPACTGPFSIANQEPITCVPGPNSLFAKRLPSDVMNHRMADDVDVAVHALSANAGSSTNVMIWAHSGSANDINGIPSYYGQASDPAYVITGGGSSAGEYNAINKPFHAPNQAFTNGASSESFLSVWDQVQNKYVYLYYGGGRHTELPKCTSTDLRHPCPLSSDPSASVFNDRNERKGWGTGGGPDSMNIVAPVGRIRVNEMIQGHIYHPIYMNVLCEQNNGTRRMASFVFPATAAAGSCQFICTELRNPCTNTDKAPPAGALFFLDYTDAQLALLKNYMPLWQYPMVEALTHYGGYAGDTGNPLHPSRMESEDAYKLAGIEDPIFRWLQGQDGISPACGVTSGQCNLPWSNFAVAGRACPADGLCDITRHIHIADSCVAKGLAGMKASEGACF
jgi:hypothetical protein